MDAVAASTARDHVDTWRAETAPQPPSQASFLAVESMARSTLSAGCFLGTSRETVPNFACPREFAHSPFLSPVNELGRKRRRAGAGGTRGTPDCEQDRQSSHEEHRSVRASRRRLELSGPRMGVPEGLAPAATRWRSAAPSLPKREGLTPSQQLNETAQEISAEGQRQCGWRRPYEDVSPLTHAVDRRGLDGGAPEHPQWTDGASSRPSLGETPKEAASPQTPRKQRLDLSTPHPVPRSVPLPQDIQATLWTRGGSASKSRNLLCGRAHLRHPDEPAYRSKRTEEALLSRRIREITAAYSKAGSAGAWARSGRGGEGWHGAAGDREPGDSWQRREACGTVGAEARMQELGVLVDEDLDRPLTQDEQARRGRLAHLRMVYMVITEKGGSGSVARVGASSRDLVPVRENPESVVSEMEIPFLLANSHASPVPRD